MKEMKKEMTKYDGKDKGKKDMKYEEGKGWIGKRKSESDDLNGESMLHGCRKH